MEHGQLPEGVMDNLVAVFKGNSAVFIDASSHAADRKRRRRTTLSVLSMT